MARGDQCRLVLTLLRLAVHPASRDFERATVHPLAWLVIEGPQGESEPSHDFSSTLPPDAELARLVDIIKLRGRIERDDEELKSELGLAHYEGRGFHHHATLCIVAYGYLIRERAAFPPATPGSAKGLVFPVVLKPEALPVRSERHVASSIATIRKAIAVQARRAAHTMSTLPNAKAGQIH